GGDERLCGAIDEILLLGIAREILEWQDGNGLNPRQTGLACPPYRRRDDQSNQHSRRGQRAPWKSGWPLRGHGSRRYAAHGLERRPHLIRALVSLALVLDQALLNHRAQPGGYVRRQRSGRIPQNRRRNLETRPAAERALARGHLVEHHA